MQQGLTYEKLFDYLREERNNVQLQSLPSTFFSDVVIYLQMKEKSLEALNESGSLTFDNAHMQYRNAKRIIEDIYERREKKLLNLALNKSRTKSLLIDTSALLPEEKILFKQMSVVLDHFRDEILKKLMKKETPIVNDEKDSITGSAPVLESAPSTDDDGIVLNASAEVSDVQSSPAKDETEANSKELTGDEDSQVALKFIQYVDKFVGPDLEILGPYDEGAVVKLPKSVADVVLKKGYAEEI